MELLGIFPYGLGRRGGFAIIELTFGVAAGLAAVTLVMRPGIIDRLVDENRASMHRGGKRWLWLWEEQDDDAYESGKRILRIAFPALLGLMAIVGVGGGLGWWN